MRVRRASDNVEADVGFDAGELKLTSPISNTSDAQSYTDLADFVDHTGTPTNAFCRWWYDQSGNSNDAGQSTAGSQPQIYDATTGLITDNGKPALSYAGSKRLDSIFSAKSISAQSSFAITSISSSSSNDRILSSANGAVSDVNSLIPIIRSGNTTTVASYLGAFASTHTFTYDTQFQFSSIHNGTALTNYFNGTSGTSYSQALSITIDRYCLGGRPDSTNNSLTGKIQEVIIYDSDQSSNRTGIESDITSYF